MPIRYCSKHERLAIVNLFGQKEGGWRDFPLENMHAIKRLYALGHTLLASPWLPKLHRSDPCRSHIKDYETTLKHCHTFPHFMGKTP